MGGQAALLNLFNDLNPSQLNTYAWIKGVKFLENHLISAIGPRQAMFTTGSGFYWTYELISNFRQKEYFYVFVFNKEHKATSSTSWQKINTNL
jgi:hypothetical protein